MAFHGLLVSSGFSALAIREQVACLARDRSYVSAHIITTARPEKEHAPWNVVTKGQLEEMGMTVSFIDFDVGESLADDVDLVYVCGGNTFHLLHSIQCSSAPIRQQIVALCDRGGLYIGSSAGAVLVSPTIASAGEVHPDKNKDGVVDLTGLHFIEQHVVPHYVPSLDGEIIAFREKYSLREDEVLLLRDGEGLYVHDAVQEIVV
ncbi:MAG: Type 1 glutamine amidotransferase-like domain-containing protein [Candidatus Kaiserbacteria bacterium]|nr:Type 1 glutamine amidotransferase-like domain-containing protein [Candidatus Kaiserbacteria bacterium]